MTTNLDDRVRVLMARLGDATPIAPEFESLTARPLQVVAAPLRPTPRCAPLVAAAAAVGLVVGAIALYRPREHDTTSAVTPSTKQVATDLPDGWSLVKAVGPGTRVEDGQPADMVLYATDQAPLGPVVGVTTSEYGLSGPERTDAIAVTLPDDRRATLSDEEFGTRWVDVEMQPNSWISWVSLESRGLDDPALLALAASVIVPPDGPPILAADAVAAAGLTPIGSGSLFGQPFLFDAGMGTPSLFDGMTIALYAPERGSDAIEVTAFTPTAFSRGALGMFIDLSATEGGVIGQVPRQDGKVGFYAERDGFAFYATGPAAMVDEIKALVASLAPVSDDEWAALVGGDVGGAGQTGERPSGSTAPAVEATVVETTAAPQKPVSSTVDIEVAVATTETTGEYVLTLTWPDGSVTEAAVSYFGRSITLRSRAPSGNELSTAVDVNTHSLGSSSEPAAGYALIEAHVAASSSARWMVVVAEGVRYRVELVQPNPSYPVKVAVLVLPVPTDGSYLEPGLQTASGIAVSR